MESIGSPLWKVLKDDGADPVLVEPLDAALEALEDRGVDDIVHLGTVEAQEGDTLPMLVVDRLAH